MENRIEDISPEYAQENIQCEAIITERWAVRLGHRCLITAKYLVEGTCVCGTHKNKLLKEIEKRETEKLKIS